MKRQSFITEASVPLESDPVLTIAAVSRTFPGATSPAVNAISFTLQKGELLGLLGPSGCGKTTLLRLIAGFEKPQEGSIRLDGVDIAGHGAWLPPEKRGIGMVFQDYALFPHLTVAHNIAFGLRPKRRNLLKAFLKSTLSSAKTQQRIADVLALVGLAGLEKRYPHQLSGGQQQRVALARALAPNPQMVLLDEPLSNLDAKVRLQLRQDLRDILKAAGATGIFVTHDQEEALSICDRVAVMQHGHLEQLGTPEELYQAPVSRFVAEFVIQANFIPAQPLPSAEESIKWNTELGVISPAMSALDSNALESHVPSPDDEAHTDLMIRQEDLRLSLDPTSKMVVCDRQFLGRENRYCIQLPSGQVIVARVCAEELYGVGDRVQVAIADHATQTFPTQMQSAPPSSLVTLQQAS